MPRELAQVIDRANYSRCNTSFSTAKMTDYTPKSPVTQAKGEPEMDADELRLAQMGTWFPDTLIYLYFTSCWWNPLCQGHAQELKRHFSIVSLIGLASTTTISWAGLGLNIVTEINAGGPSAIIYGFIRVTVLQSFLGASLPELVSSYPTKGGMYHWIAAIAPKKYSAFLSFMMGWLTVCGCKSGERRRKDSLVKRRFCRAQSWNRSIYHRFHHLIFAEVGTCIILHRKSHREID